MSERVEVSERGGKQTMHEHCSRTLLNSSTPLLYYHDGTGTVLYSSTSSITLVCATSAGRGNLSLRNSRLLERHVPGKYHRCRRCWQMVNPKI